MQKSAHLFTFTRCPLLSTVTHHLSPNTSRLSLSSLPATVTPTVTIHHHCHRHQQPSLLPITITIYTVTVTCHRCCHHLPLLSPLLSNSVTCHHYHCYCNCPPSPVIVTCYCHWSLVVVTMTVHYQHHPSSLTITCHTTVLNYALAHAVAPSQLSTSTFSQLSSLIFLKLCNENCSKILVIFIQ